MKFLTRFLSVMILAAVTAFSAEAALSVPAAPVFFGSVGVSVIMSFIPMPDGISFMALQTELWTGELIKHFRHSATFLGRIGNRNQYVNNNAIHLVDLGADPAVLINNTTYPINSARRTDEDVVISLDKFDTENTIITDDELHALPYDKPGSVIEQHRLALEEKTAEKAIHSLCPERETTDTPIIMTTGVNNHYEHPRRRLTIEDIIRAKKALDDLKVPTTGRELVLCNQHVEDLLLTSQAFKDQFFKIKEGTILDMFGFIVSQFVANPLFSNTTGQKKAFGTAANPEDDLQTSVFYYNKRAAQARGTAKMYYKDAKTDTKYRQSEIGFRLYHICLPKKNTGFGAIVSDAI